MAKFGPKFTKFGPISRGGAGWCGGEGGGGVRGWCGGVGGEVVGIWVGVGGMGVVGWSWW